MNFHSLASAKNIGPSDRDVPFDGNCMLSTISYQLQANGMCNADGNELRQNVVHRLKINAAFV